MTSIITVDELGFCINKTGPAIESLDKSELANICILASNYLKEIAIANPSNESKRDDLIIEQVFTIISANAKKIVIKCKVDQGVAVVEL